MKVTIKYVILSVFVCYWLATVVFNLPDNYVNISLYRYSQLFQLPFSQRWAFFAPPPTFDERLYYSFIDKNDSTIRSYEVLQAINEKKARHAPFNWNDDIKDYLLSNSVISLNDLVSDYREFHDEEKDKSSGQAGSDEGLEQYLQASSYFKTLQNYARIVAESNSIDPDQYSCFITISRVYIPKFVDRYDGTKRREELFLKSKPFNL